MATTPRRTLPNSFFRSLPQVELHIVRGRARHLTRAVTSTVFLIGGGLECDLVLGDARFEGVHSYLLRTPERVMLRRLADGPEIRVDGATVEMAELTSGCQVCTGPYEFRVQIAWPERRIDGAESAESLDAAEGWEHDANEARGMAIVGALLADIRQALLPRPTLSTSGALHRRSVRFRPDAA